MLRVQNHPFLWLLPLSPIVNFFFSLPQSRFSIQGYTNREGQGWRWESTFYKIDSSDTFLKFKRNWEGKHIFHLTSPSLLPPPKLLCLSQGSANVLYQGLHSKHCRPCRPFGPCYSHSALPLHKSSHRPNLNNGAGCVPVRLTKWPQV